MTPPTRSILFVDDEPHLLAGLRRMLHGKRGEWDMTFVGGGVEALEHLRSHPVDVVVSDMRMPGMDGAQLLAEVRRLHPQTSRMILSGHADRASIISAVGPTQQYLAKPCDAQVLAAAVDRVLAVRDLVTDERLRRVLGEVEALPKPPGVYEEMLTLAADPECRLEDVVAVIERDVATCAEVLRLVNSSFFGLPVRVASIARAVSLLGLETIQALAVAGAVFASGGDSPPGLEPAELTRRGLAAGQMVRLLASVDGWPREAAGDLFFAGLLHEVGLPLLARADLEAWDRLRAGQPAGGRPADPWELAERQREAFGCTAAEASAYLLGLWGFREVVVEAVAGMPARCCDPAATPAAHLLTLAQQSLTAAVVPVLTDERCYLTSGRLAAWARAGLPVCHG